jgi:nicotinate-nucleotide adenylyltransferase
MWCMGLLGGTFDPVHFGHLQLAGCAMDLCHLDEIVFIPTASPPHKPQEKICAFHHRVAMLKLALGGNPRYSVSEIESIISPPTYTIDMFSYMVSGEEAETDYYFILGLDTFLDIPNWKEYKKVINSVHFIVSARPGFSEDAFSRCIKFLKYEKYKEYWYDETSGKKIFFLNIDTTDISSSKLRKMMDKPEKAKSYVPATVLRYIEQNHLYMP